MLSEQFQCFYALAIGFAVAGLIATLYQLITERPASFRLLQGGPRVATFAAIPLLAFAAPFIIMRNTLRGTLVEHRRFQFVMLSTVLSGGWSMMSGNVVLMALQAIGSM